MKFDEKSKLDQRRFVPESVWPLLSYYHYGPDDDYEDGIRAQADVTDPEKSIYTPADDAAERKPFDFEDVVRLIKDGVVDNLIDQDGAAKVGISANDERALVAFVSETQKAWEKCVDRLTVNRIAETKAKRIAMDNT